MGGYCDDGVLFFVLFFPGALAISTPWKGRALLLWTPEARTPRREDEDMERRTKEKKKEGRQRGKKKKEAQVHVDVDEDVVGRRIIA